MNNEGQATTPEFVALGILTAEGWPIFAHGSDRSFWVLAPEVIVNAGLNWTADRLLENSRAEAMTATNSTPTTIEPEKNPVVEETP